MAKKRLSVLENLLKSALKLDRSSSMKDRFWIWRSSLLSAQADPTAGFVLPTVTLLLLMLSLILGVLIFRTGNRTTEVIGDRQQRQVYNAATPAVERAKAKLEYLFTKENLSTPPTDQEIENVLNKNKTNAASDIYTLAGETRVDIGGTDGGVDSAWTFKYDSQGRDDDPADDVQIVYSILTRLAFDPDNDPENGNEISLEDRDTAKANSLVVRNAPINLDGGAGNPACQNDARSPYQGWLQANGSQLRKAIQVHAVAIPGPDNPNKTVATLEFQQDKVSNLGNKWAAWFRTDMEIFPGPAFRFNGAINSSGSYFVSNTSGQPLELYPISSPRSCAFTEDASEMVMSRYDENDQNVNNALEGNKGEAFQGQFVVGKLGENEFEGRVKIFSARDFGAFTGNGFMEPDEDSVLDNGNGAPGSPIEIALDPVALLTEGINRRRDDPQPAPTTYAAAQDFRDPNWDKGDWVTENRLYNKNVSTPFVDDTYRADNRFGPKPVYDPSAVDEADPNQPVLKLKDGESVNDPTKRIEIGTSTGADGRVDQLTRLNPRQQVDDSDSDDSAQGFSNENDYGLDGYWERRARAQGVRIIVGQRLELGNAYGWKTEIDANGNGDTTETGDLDLDGDGVLDFDPLYPSPSNPGGTGSMRQRQHELMQRKTLRSNPAAAQSTAVYHYLMAEGAYPVACLASASHAGTYQADLASRTFERAQGKTVPNVNFLTGEGTSGWEFEPFGYNAYASNTFRATEVQDDNLGDAHDIFATAVNNPNSELRVVLSNLANFSGDLRGAFPAFQDSGDDAVTHPYPIQTMWGDFSNLRRAMDKLDNGATYSTDFKDKSRSGNSLSLADQTTLQTASCTLGMLAYNLDNVVKDEKANREFFSDNRPTLVSQLNKLTDKNDQNGEIRIENGELIVYQATEDATITPEERIIYKAKAADVTDRADLGALVYNPTPWAVDVARDEGRAARSIPSEILAQALPADGRALAAEMMEQEQIKRDRLRGFANASPTSVDYQVQYEHDNILGMSLVDLKVIPDNNRLGGTDAISIQCDLESTNYFGLGRPSTWLKEQERAFLTLAFAFCPTSVKYPALYYLFPRENHDHIGSGTQYEQPDTEPYTSNDRNGNGRLTQNGATFDNDYGIDSNTTNPIGPGGDQTFRVVGASPDTGFKAIALRPKRKNVWSLPNIDGLTVDADENDCSEDIPSVFDPDNAGFNAAAICDRVSDTVTLNQKKSTAVNLALIDKVLFDGREQMAVRTLDVDLNQLRRNQISGTGPLGAATDFWLPLPKLVADSPTRTGAVIYAFREDAVREDGIARPSSASGDDFDTWSQNWRKASLSSNDLPPNYAMNAAAFNTNNEQDPPVNPDNGISPKAVDYYADPSRRPHGFRLKNGIDLRRPGNIDDKRGLTFISDNSVYIFGDFNKHTPSTDIAQFEEDAEQLQEFKTPLALDWSNFDKRDDNNTDFADPTEDAWRASEVVADAVTILSDDFVDGWVSQGLLIESDFDPIGSGGGIAQSSFQALNQPQNEAMSWVREDGKVYPNDNDIGTSEASPIKISQRGFPVYCSRGPNNAADATGSPVLQGLDAEGLSCLGRGGVEREYGLGDAGQGFLTFETKRSLINVNGPNYVNALIVSGIVPSRVNQSNGGLHNFPRFIENWQGQVRGPQNATALRFQGSLFQLNFSNASASPFEQDAWEPGSLPAGGGEVIWFYRPPGRQWGFDVAIQLVPPTPVAERFNDNANIRSEFYQELPVDDPYIVNLRCVKLGGTKIDPTVSDAACGA